MGTHYEIGKKQAKIFVPSLGNYDMVTTFPGNYRINESLINRCPDDDDEDKDSDTPEITEEQARAEFPDLIDTESLIRDNPNHPNKIKPR